MMTNMNTERTNKVRKAIETVLSNSEHRTKKDPDCAAITYQDLLNVLQMLPASELDKEVEVVCAEDPEVLRPVKKIELNEIPCDANYEPINGEPVPPHIEWCYRCQVIGRVLFHI